MKPNLEQQAIIDTFLSRTGSIAVNALAGTGKTTTLKMLAQAAPKQRMQYIAFNKSIADDARSSMPRNVEVSTMHSLAYRAMQPDRARLETRLNGGFVAREFDVVDYRVQLENGSFEISANSLASMALETVSRYCNSGDNELQHIHVPSWGRIYEVAPPELDEDVALEDVVFRLAQKVWSTMRDRKSRFPITHDTYLKLWSLAMGQIKSEVIFFDEAQDASPVFLEILANQHPDRRVVFVGDANQQIYSWRGAVDALARIRADQRYYLTRSYRFGQVIADQANRMLTCLGEKHLLIGEGSGHEKDGSSAILCRTNARAIATFCDTPGASLVGAREFLSMVRSLDNLIEGHGPTGAFALFPAYTDLVEYAYNTPDGADLKPLLDLVDRLGIQEVLSRLERSTLGGRAHGPTVSTIHKSKGREWDYVRLEGDWKNPKRKTRADEMRLMYVGLTRGRCNVDAKAVTGYLDLCEEIAAGNSTAMKSDDTPISDLAIAVIESAKARAAAEPALATEAAAEPAPAKKPRKRAKRTPRSEA